MDLVDYATASRHGEPYAALIDRKGFLPSVTMRFCSSFLKRDRINTVARHRLGLKRWHSVIGLRADERRRVLRMRTLILRQPHRRARGAAAGRRGRPRGRCPGLVEGTAFRPWHPRLRWKLHALHAQGPGQAASPDPRKPGSCRLVDRPGTFRRRAHRPGRPSLRIHDTVQARRNLHRVESRRAGPGVG